MELKESICNILLIIVSICTIISYAPQIIQLIKTKKSEDIAVSSWVLWTTASTSYLIYSFIVADFMLIVSSLLEFSLNLTVLILSIKYK